MGLTWAIIGLLAGLSVLAYVELAKRFRLDWKAWCGLILGEFLLLFSIAWCVASVAEGVPQSATGVSTTQARSKDSGIHRMLDES